MTPLFKKLQYKGSDEIVCLDAPDSFQAELKAMKPYAAIITNASAATSISFAIAFVTQQAQIDDAVKALVPKLEPDAVLWFCYPKGTSKKYKCDFNRDSGWQALGDVGFEGVRMVAVDEDWSALRFRKADNIKKITRRESFAVSAAAKARTTNKGR